MREYDFMREEFERRYPQFVDQLVTITRLAVSRGYYDALIARYAIDYPQIQPNTYQWLMIANDNPEWEIVDMEVRVERPLHNAVEEAAYDVAFD